jgi:5-methylthioribose kinase
VEIDDRSLGPYIQSLGLLPAGPLEVEPAGDGNINYVRRVSAPGIGSVIVKHARPTLERFPEYRAPPERLLFEHAYGEVVRELAPKEASVLPRVIHFDPAARLLVLEDLGQAPRLEEELLAGHTREQAVARIGQFLGRVHAATRGRAEELAPRFQNEGMRELHGEHIFTIPFAPNDFPIRDEVRQEAARLLDPKRLDRVRALRRNYYESRAALVHADVQPGNILLVEEDPKLLDAEISHIGDPAFDLGTALAHLRLNLSPLGGDRLERAENALLAGYLDGKGAREEVDRAFAYAAVEILRRTIGAARVRAVESTDRAIAAVRDAVELLDA